MFRFHKRPLIPLLLAATIIAALLCQVRGDVWEEKVRTVLYSLKKDSVPSYATEMVDTNGVPYVYYAPQNNIAAGTQYNPTIVANYALNYYRNFLQSKDSSQLVHFNHCLEFLRSNTTAVGNAELFLFRWQQPWYPHVGQPFTSGMTSGRAIEAYVDAFRLYHDSTFLHRAQKLLRGFFIPIQDSGFTYQSAEGWWYEEIAHANDTTPHILDGHIFAILGVQQFWQQTRNDSALMVVQKGLAALKYQLPHYDAGNGRIHYDIYNKEADKKYQKILAGQMQQLWRSTGDSTFLTYFNKWNAPMQRPYLLRAFQEGNRSGILLFAFLIATVWIVLLVGFKLVLSRK